MRARFWGVRGSTPAPLSPQALRSKISAVIERATPADLASSASRERFLASLPPWLFGTVGGNTPCVEIRLDDGGVVIFDAGTGIRDLGVEAARELAPPRRYRIFFSHFHWDHIQGLPFFGPAYDESVSLEFYSPVAGFEAILGAQMRSPYFPIDMSVMNARKSFTVMEAPVRVGQDATVSYRPMRHPGGSYSFAVCEGSKRLIYSTDTELTSDDFLRTDENAAFFGGADLLIIDSQYTLGEAIEKYNWGHSAFSLAADFAATWGIRKLVLFHHDPGYDDRKLYGMLQSAAWYIDHLAAKGVEASLAVEGTILSI